MTLPGIPFEQAAGDGGYRSRTQVVIIHATDSTASAEGEASYATRRPDQTSAHFYVDDDSAVQAVRLDHIAFGALWHGNQISIQFELCGRSNRLSDATMRQAAPLVAEVCKRYGIPVRKISASQVRNGVRGICGHSDITAAFPQDHGDHTDPGPDFPWSRFLDYVNGGDDEMDQHTFDQRVANLGTEARKTLATALLTEDVFKLHPGAKGDDVVWLQTVLQRLLTGQAANAAALQALATATGKDPEKVYAAIREGTEAAVTAVLRPDAGA